MELSMNSEHVDEGIQGGQPDSERDADREPASSRATGGSSGSALTHARVLGAPAQEPP